MQVGDKVRLKEGLEDGNMYGSVLYEDCGYFSGVGIIEIVNREGFIRIGAYWYSEEMLDFVGNDGKEKETPILEEEHSGSNHDDHYAKQREAGNETIVALELFAEQLKPKIIDGSISMAQFVNMILAKKNFDRAGTKDNPLQEIAKAENYLHRARNGEWRK